MACSSRAKSVEEWTEKAWRPMLSTCALASGCSCAPCTLIPHNLLVPFCSFSHTDYYDVLGVSETAAADDIRRAFRRAARKLHPGGYVSMHTPSAQAFTSQAHP